MAKRIYVGGLPPTVDADRLQSLFGAYGEVSDVQIVSDRNTGQGKGFAFVEMATGGDADKAIEALNGSDMDGRALVVNEARAREGHGRNRG